MSIHDGHRQRLRERLEQEDLDNFTEVQVLELLLFYCISRQDTNELAHNLIERFGSLAQVLEASPDNLQKVKGIGEHSAVFLNLIPKVSRYYKKNRENATKILTNLTECGRYIANYLHGRSNETVFVLCLDAKGKVLCCREIGEGSINCASVSARRVVEVALGVKATMVVMAHNHPSGIAIPSSEDVATTHRVAAALAAVDITLADHIVVADDDYVSMVQSGYYRPGEFAQQY